MNAMIALIILTLSSWSFATPRACLPLFSTKSLLTVTVSDLFASQDNLGHEYSRIKTLKQAGLDPEKSLKDLSKSELNTLYKNLLKELDQIPVVIAPNGKIFMTDGHHDMFVLSQIEPHLENVHIHVILTADFSGTTMTMEEFKILGAKNNWFYGNINNIVDNPKKVIDLPDNMERSQMGLVFRYILETYDIPFKGKHFAPFIQFTLIDILKKQNLYDFKDTKNKTIKSLAQLVLTNELALETLISLLKSDAPIELKKFLADQLASASK